MPKGTYVFTGYDYRGAHVPNIEFETPEEHQPDERGRTFWVVTIDDALKDQKPLTVRAADGNPKDVFRDISSYLYNLLSSTEVDRQTPNIIDKITEINDARPKPTQ